MRIASNFVTVNMNIKVGLNQENGEKYQKDDESRTQITLL